ncbi:MAG: response regulator [Elusimicrobiaceae bacterium]
MADRGVLIVDDDVNLRESLCEIFEISDISASCVDSALAALRAGTSLRPKVVITDYQLPDGNGHQVCANLKKMVCDVHVLVMTGRAFTAEEKAEGEAAGVDGYLLKPFDLAALSGNVKKILSGEKK